ncbi:MAG: DUF4339 domain-containing protein [Candidatus Sumerlaeota bacterium]|nr:DUF4339 domain-containing protein [Candidatus Sumerlaeota bacterium]
MDTNAGNASTEASPKPDGRGTSGALGQNPPSLPKQWYVSRGGTHQGPVAIDQVVAAIGCRELALTDLCWKTNWRQGIEQWTPIGAVAEITDYLRACGGGGLSQQEILEGMRKAQDLAMHYSNLAIQRVREFADSKNVQKMKKLSQEATRNAFTAFMLFAINPMAGLPLAYQKLGKKGALSAGIVFFIIYEAAVLIAAKVAGIQLAAGDWFNAAVVLAVPFAAVALVSMGLRLVSSSRETFHAEIFFSGAAFLSIVIFALIAYMASGINPYLIVPVAMFGACYLILLFYSAHTRIYRLSESVGTFSVPLMLILAAWLTYKVLGRMFASQLGNLEQFLR